ncbi:Uncharacterised protein [Helicobacter muridarum]|uniref:Uncharacterized protein n=2 Tax=Helicobacter muridarum TaxID=216 RepID=A0A099U1E8_9HELI|nr:Uncharacterised protein [Helicobacter muridarum]
MYSSGFSGLSQNGSFLYPQPQNKNMLRVKTKNCANILIMKTFKEIFTSDFSKQLINRQFTSPEFANSIVDSYILNQLRIFLPSNLRHHLTIIMRSKIHANQIAFGFNSQAACIEFNKYHAKKIYEMIWSNCMLKKKMRLEDCKSMQGFVAKRHARLHDIIEITNPKIKEPAYGTFINHATNKKLHSQFERIRNMIINHHKQLDRLRSQKIDSKPEIYNLHSKTIFRNNRIK